MSECNKDISISKQSQVGLTLNASFSLSSLATLSSSFLVYFRLNSSLLHPSLPIIHPLPAHFPCISCLPCLHIYCGSVCLLCTYFMLFFPAVSFLLNFHILYFSSFLFILLLLSFLSSLPFINLIYLNIFLSLYFFDSFALFTILPSQPVLKNGQLSLTRLFCPPDINKKLNTTLFSSFPFLFKWHS